MDKETTFINADTFRPLEVEWVIESPRLLQEDGSFKQVEQQKVSLVRPERYFQDVLMDHRQPILNLDPQTALNLLDWLRKREEALKRLVDAG